MKINFIVSIVFLIGVLSVAAHAGTNDYIPWPNAAGRGSSAGEYQRPPATNAELEAARRLQQRLIERSNPGYKPGPVPIKVVPATPQRPQRSSNSLQALERARTSAEDLRRTLLQTRNQAVTAAEREIVGTRDANGVVRLQSVPRTGSPTGAQQARIDEATRQLVAQENSMVDRGLLKPNQRTIVRRTISQRTLDMLSATDNIRAAQQRLIERNGTRNQPPSITPAARTPEAIENAARREAVARATDDERARRVNDAMNRNSIHGGPIVNATNKVIDANAKLARRVLRAPIITGKQIVGAAERTVNSLSEGAAGYANARVPGTNLTRAEFVRQKILDAVPMLKEISDRFTSSGTPPNNNRAPSTPP